MKNLRYIWLAVDAKNQIAYYVRVSNKRDRLNPTAYLKADWRLATLPLDVILKTFPDVNAIYEVHYGGQQSFKF